MVAARARLAWAFTWLPGAVVLACAGMVALAALDDFAWWQVLPVIGALVPFLACQAANPPPPRWPHTAFLTAAGQLLLGAIPAYGVAAATAAGPALPLFLIAWIGLIASIPLARGALKALMSPLTPDLGATPLTLRFGVRTAIERADTITTGVTLGLTHLVAHARRHAAYSRGNPTEIAVPLGEILGVRPVVLPAMLPWLSLSDGTRLLATAGPAVELATRSGEFLIPTDDAALLTELIARRCAFAGQTR
ncbi:hypothetical protein BLA60_26845 [Actinophytocola xinjiangensis]|uniref:Uncharacterized protein n=2 Tax=Actinophytocola xinjiangensis TaxID=485602 RepID=A0A7Z1AVP5_9PSEU|nr:hypothetical protein BLA60_26845 [Actinophytocola xinjiangensis]